MSLSRIPIFLSLGFLLSSCSSNYTATGKFQSSYNFSSIQSYSIFERNSRFGEYQNVSDATRNGIEIAIEQALENHGLVYRNNDDADIIIGYHIIDKSKELIKYNKGVKFYRSLLLGESEQDNQKKWNMTPGSLILDAVSTQHNRSIWRSVYPLKINEDDNSFEVQDKILNAIASMIKTLPKSV